MTRVKQPVVHKNGIVNRYYLKDKDAITLLSCRIDPRIFKDCDENPDSIKPKKESFIRETLPGGFVFYRQDCLDKQQAIEMLKAKGVI